MVEEGPGQRHDGGGGRGDAGGGCLQRAVPAAGWRVRCWWRWEPLPALAQLLRIGEQGGQARRTLGLPLRLAPGTWGLSAQAGLSPLHPSPFLSLTLRSVAILTKSNPFTCGEPGGYPPRPGDKGGVCSTVTVGLGCECR